MIRITTLLFFLAFTVTAFAQAPSIKFEKETYNFGDLSEGDLAVHEFTFTNTGNAPLVITDVKRSCGCTIPAWTTNPIQPGETGTIKVVFNSKDRPGPIIRNIFVTTNEKKNSTKTLYITGMVTPEM